MFSGISGTSAAAAPGESGGAGGTGITLDNPRFLGGRKGGGGVRLGGGQGGGVGRGAGAWERAQAATTWDNCPWQQLKLTFPCGWGFVRANPMEPS